MVNNMDFGVFLFCLGIFIVLHTYIFYPIVISIWDKYLGKAIIFDDLIEFPPVTLLIPGHNVEHLIDSKIKNIMNLKYRGDLSFLFILDGCNDETENKLKLYSDSNPRYPIKIFSNPVREGKEAAIRKAITEVETNIIAFSDADAILQEDCVERLISSLVQPNVGAVCGREIHAKNNAHNASEGQGLFYIFEEFIKEKLTRIGSLTYIQGGNFAMYKDLYPKEIPSGCTQDGIIAFDVVLSRHKVVYEPRAVTTEEYNLSNSEDFNRRIRTISRAFYSIICRPDIFNPFKVGSYFYHILSGRLLRWLTLPILSAAGIVGLFIENNFINWLVIYGLVFCTFLVILGYLLEKIKKRMRLPYLVYYFMYIHFAAAVAIFRVVLGKRVTTWKPSN